jgi:hypothetical protein
MYAYGGTTRLSNRRAIISPAVVEKLWLENIVEMCGLVETLCMQKEGRHGAGL